MKQAARKGYEPKGDNDQSSKCVLSGEPTTRFYRGKPLSKASMERLRLLRDELTLEYTKKFKSKVALTTGYVLAQILAGEDLDRELEELRNPEVPVGEEAKEDVPQGYATNSEGQSEEPTISIQESSERE